jgi:hypothetical protein
VLRINAVGLALTVGLCLPALLRAADAVVSQLHQSFVSGTPAPNVEGKYRALADRIKSIQRGGADRERILGVAQEFSSLQRPVDASAVLTLYLREKRPTSMPQPTVPLDRMAQTQTAVTNALGKNAQALKAGIVDAEAGPAAVAAAGKQPTQGVTVAPTRAYRSVDRVDIPSPHDRFKVRMETFDRQLEKAKKDSASDCETAVACFDARMKVAYNTLGTVFNGLGASFTGEGGGKELGKFAACNAPLISVGCAVSDFYDSPTVFAGAMISLSAIPGVRAAKKLIDAAIFDKVAAAAAKAERLSKIAPGEQRISVLAPAYGLSAAEVEEAVRLERMMRARFPESTLTGQRYLAGDRVSIADQGIKLRIDDPGYGAREEILWRFMELTRMPELAGRYRFKVDLINEATEGTQRGKFITIWTQDPRSAREIAATLDSALDNVKISGKVELPPEDFLYGKSGLISWRYGSNYESKLAGKDSRTGNAIETYDDRANPRGNLLWAYDHAWEDGLEFWIRQAGLASPMVTRIKLMANSKTFRYARPIDITLAGRKVLQIVSTKDLPSEAAALGRNEGVGYFILDPSRLAKEVGYKGLRDGETVQLGRANPQRFEGLSDGQRISRNHLTIRRSGDDILIEDHSTNGTVVSYQAP